MGSRRIAEVWPSRYSPDDFPSSSRAAPAKNRSWSTPWSTSSLAMYRTGWPVSRACTALISSRRPAIAVARSRRYACRAPGVSRFHVVDARSAAAYARSTSSCVEIGERPSGSPVTGSTRSMKSVAADAAGREVDLLAVVVEGHRARAGQHDEHLVDLDVGRGARRHLPHADLDPGDRGQRA